MEMERRRFLKTVGGALGAVILAPSLELETSAASFGRACACAEDERNFWRLVRKQFLLPQGYAYLNTGGLGASPFMVTEKVKRMMDAEETHPDAGHDMDDWWEIKSKCLPFLGAGCRKEELALTSTATEGINIVVKGLPLGRGDEVITSTHEHVALKIPLLHRMQTDGIVIKTFEPDLQRALGNVEKIESLMTSKTRLIFLSHITCTTGQIFPAKEIGELARAKGIWYALDGVQAIAQMPLELKETGVDFYAVSGHKWMMGPKRTGILYVREERLEQLRPLVVGAYSDRLNDMEARKLEFHPTAQRYEYATQNEALFYGLAEAADFVGYIGVGRIWERNRRMAEMFHSGLRRIRSIEILSPQEESCRSSMITFRFAGRENGPLCAELTGKGLRVRGVGEAGLDAIRVSFHVYNDEEEVERLLAEISKLA
jgi:selenocysteine lyase/cysteine desulfurase